MPPLLRRLLEVAAIATVFGVLTTGLAAVQLRLRQQAVSWAALVGPELLFWYAWGVVALLIFRLAARWPLAGAQRGTRLVHSAGCLLLPLSAYLLYLGAYAGAALLLGRLSGATLWLDLRGQFWGYYLVGPGVLLGAVTYWGLVAVVSARTYFGRLQVAEVRRSRLEAQLVQAQLQTLKAQLHPHFLFNTFNSISSLLQTDPAAADRMLARLGDFLRLTLAHTHVEFVSLVDEIAFVRLYLDIELIRFADRLRVVINVDPAAQTARVPALLLQPLVENAVKHGIARRPEPGQISLTATRTGAVLVLCLRNDGGPAPTPTPGFTTSPPPAGGHGLTATAARLHQLYGPTARLTTETLPDDSFRVTLTLPYQAQETATAR